MSTPAERQGAEGARSDRLAAVARAIDDVRAGRMVILVDDEDRENEGDLVLAADLVTPLRRSSFMARHGRGLICLSLTEERVDALGLAMMSGRQPLAAPHGVHGEHRRAPRNDDGHPRRRERAGTDPRGRRARRQPRRSRDARPRVPAARASRRRARAVGPHRGFRRPGAPRGPPGRRPSSARTCARTARWRACPISRRSRPRTASPSSRSPISSSTVCRKKCSCGAPSSRSFTARARAASRSRVPRLHDLHDRGRGHRSTSRSCSATSKPDEPTLVRDADGERAARRVRGVVQCR